MVADRLTEWVGRTVVVLLAAGLPAAILVTRAVDRQEVVVLRGRMPEAGGWTPGTLTAVVGKPLRLRLTSADVMHGFALGRDHRAALEVKPGSVTEVTLQFDRPGKYTFYCSRWCGPNHWRMRGTIEVTGAGADPDPTPPAPYIALGIDLDTPHPAAARPDRKPSPARGRSLEAEIPDAKLAREYVRRHSPAAVWLAFRGDSGMQMLTDRQLWDLVAFIWRGNTSTGALEVGRRLYAQNCAACHGTGGRGDGVMVAALPETPPARTADTVRTSPHGSALARPVDFTKPDFLGASPVLLHGKILRGGMGTGMPYWGPLFTDAEIWAVVDYLYSFQFTYDPEEDSDGKVPFQPKSTGAPEAGSHTAGARWQGPVRHRTPGPVPPSVAAATTDAHRSLRGRGGDNDRSPDAPRRADNHRRERPGGQTRAPGRP